MKKACIYPAYALLRLFGHFFSRRIPAVLIDHIPAYRTDQVSFSGDLKRSKIKILFTFGTISEHDKKPLSNSIIIILSVYLLRR